MSPEERADLVEERALEMLLAAMKGFDDFMSVAACADSIRKADLVETAKAVFTAGFTEGFSFAGRMQKS